jgi:hypothetical protein
LTVKETNAATLVGNDYTASWYVDTSAPITSIVRSLPAFSALFADESSVDLLICAAVYVGDSIIDCEANNVNIIKFNWCGISISISISRCWFPLFVCGWA